MTLPSARKDSSTTAASPGSERFPQSRRLRKRAEFQRAYQEGTRVSGAFFTAFCWRSGRSGPARIGLTVPRSLGGAVVRNRIKRRLREAVRRHWPVFPDGWDIVIHVRRPILGADWAALETEIQRVIRQAGRSAD